MTRQIEGYNVVITIIKLQGLYKDNYSDLINSSQWFTSRELPMSYKKTAMVTLQTATLHLQAENYTTLSSTLQ